jgi:hypothetical protein
MNSVKNYMHLTPTFCVLHILLISYNLCFLPNVLHAFDTHTMHATCPTNILPSCMISAIILHAFSACTMRATWTTNTLSSMISANCYMYLTSNLSVLHALLISYDLRFLPKRLHAFDTHTMRATNILSSMLSVKRLQAFDNFFMRATCPTSILTSMKSTKIYMHLKPTLCVLHALLI